MNRNSVASILVLPVLALSACGGGGGGNSDEDQIRQIVTDSGKTPSKLCDNLAAAPLKAIGGKDKCKSLAKGQKGTDVKISSVTVNGDNATVKATGSGSDTGDIKLIKENGDWKIGLES
jgi:hypothetical protein